MAAPVLWEATDARVLISSAISSIDEDIALLDQQYFVSQATQDTLINVGKSTVTDNDDVTEVAQSFTADGPFIGKVTAWAGKAGTPTDKIVCKIYSDDTNAPSSTLIATSAGLEATDLATTPEAENFIFTFSDYNYSMRTGDKYWIVFDRTGSASDTNYFKIHYKGTASTVASQALSRSDNNMTSWTVDTKGYDLYHIIYAGEMPVKDIKISGAERDVEGVKLFGFNEKLHLKRATPVEFQLTIIAGNSYPYEFVSGVGVSVTATDYFRNTFGEKSSSDRTAKSIIFVLNDPVTATKNVVFLGNNVYGTNIETSLESDNYVEHTITFKCLATQAYEEDNY